MHTPPPAGGEARGLLFVNGTGAGHQSPPSPALVLSEDTQDNNTALINRICANTEGRRLMDPL